MSKMEIATYAPKQLALSVATATEEILHHYAKRYNTTPDKIKHQPGFSEAVLKKAKEYVALNKKLLSEAGIPIETVKDGVSEEVEAEMKAVKKAQNGVGNIGGMIKPDVKRYMDLGLTPSYSMGGGAHHKINYETGEVHTEMPLDAPPDEKGRWEHNRRLVENKQKTLARLRAKYNAKHGK